MANAAWPAQLPQFVLEDGFSEKMPARKMETSMEAGRPKSRNRFTTNWRPFTARIALHPEQRAIFEGFYGSTLAGGNLPFDWVHPVTRVAATFKFRLPEPEYGRMNGIDVVSFAMDQVA